MSTRRHEDSLREEQHFPEAVAQWRLAMRTEVKNTSSLPTSVFHTRDAMLEAFLAETTETMLARLHEPDAGVQNPAHAGEQRLETVTPEELRQLPRHLRGDGDAPVGLDDHLTAESLAVLTDACCSGHEPSAAGAAFLLRREFAIDPDKTPEAATAQLLQSLQGAMRGQPAAATSLATLCQRIVAAIAMLPRDPGPGGTP